jgi:hypothetical protein
MALVGNISGSSSTNSQIGVTGSVIFSNNPAGSFPSSLPGTDVQFFVSGSVGGKGGITRNVAVFGGDTVISGALTVGSGSVVVTSNNIQIGSTGHIQFGTAANRVELAGSDLKFFDGNNTSGKTLAELASGGGGGSFFTETSSGVIYNSGSVAFTGARTGETITAASDKGTDVQFYFSGSNDGTKTTLFGGTVASSGSIKVLGPSGVLSSQISNLGVISGSGNLSAGGDLTVAGDAAINGGDLTTTSTGTATLFNTNATTVNIAGGATSGTTVGNATGGVTLNGTATVTGDLAVNGATSADITTTTATATVFNTTATNLSIGGAATTMTVGATSGNTTIRNNLIVKGDLYISGTTTTIDSTTMEVQDPIIGLGFASGSVAGTVGDRGFIGGLSGENNIAMYWDESEDGFAVARTATAPGAAPVVVTDYQTIRAGKLEVGGGTTAYVTSSVGSDIMLYANGNSTVKANTGVVTLNGASGKGTSFEIAGVQFAELKDSSTNVQFGAVSSKQITLSGSVIQLNAGGAVNVQSNGVRVGQFIGTTGNNFRLLAMNDSGAATTAVISGSGLDLGANSAGMNLKFVDTTRGTLTYGANTLTLGTNTGVALSLSASNGFNVVHGVNGASFIEEFATTAYLVADADGLDARLRSAADFILRADGNDFKFNNATQTVLSIAVAGNNANIAGAANQQVAIGAVGASGIMNVSGSTVNANAGAGGFVFQRDGVPELHVNAVGSTTTISGSSAQNVTLGSGTGSTTLGLSGSNVTITSTGVSGGATFKADVADIVKIYSGGANRFDLEPLGTSTTANIANVVSTTVNIAGAATTVEIGAASGTTSINNNLTVDGSTTLGNATSDDITFTGRAASDLLPKTDSFYNLGSAANRWANIYTGDLHLRNDRGNWTIIEEEDYLSITNNLSGKRYKFVLEEL